MRYYWLQVHPYSINTLIISRLEFELIKTAIKQTDIN